VTILSPPLFQLSMPLLYHFHPTSYFRTTGVSSPSWVGSISSTHDNRHRASSLFVDGVLDEQLEHYSKATSAFPLPLRAVPWVRVVGRRGFRSRSMIYQARIPVYHDDLPLHCVRGSRCVCFLVAELQLPEKQICRRLNIGWIVEMKL